MTAAAAEPHLSVVVLAFNEEQNLGPSSDEILAELKQLGVSWELIIVDDGSSDGTGTLADVIAAREPHVRVVHHPQNLGLGGGYRTGFREVRGEWVVFYAADGQYPASIIGDFLRKSADADMVVGYLDERRSGVVGKSLSYAERVLYQLMFGRLPRYQGVLMFRRKLLAELPLVSEGRGWAIIMELLIRASRGSYRLVGAPNKLRPRLSGESKVNNVRNVVSNLVQVWQLNSRL